MISIVLVVQVFLKSKSVSHKLRDNDLSSDEIHTGGQ